MTESLDTTPVEIDTRRKWVRVTGRRGDSFIEFDFAIGEQELFVEMILTPEAFEDFCQANNVETMPDLVELPDDEDSEDAQWDWRLADATQVRFKN